jgi:opacity protein-like surface antigen
MKLFLAVALMICVFASSAFAIKYISGYSRNDGTYVSGHYRDTSNDGNSYNNANYLGLNK